MFSANVTPDNPIRFSVMHGSPGSSSYAKLEEESLIVAVYSRILSLINGEIIPLHLGRNMIFFK